MKNKKTEVKTGIVMMVITPLLFLTGCTSLVYVNQVYPEQISTTSNVQVFKMRTNGTHKINISNRNRSEYSPDVRSDGKKIVFLTVANDLYVMDINGSNPIPVPNAPRDCGDPKWGRNGNGNNWDIFFTYPFSPVQSSVYRIKLDGSELTRLTNPGPGEEDENVDEYSDKFVVFDRMSSTGNYDRDLWIKYIWDDRPEVRLTNTSDESESIPVVSHNGKLIAYRVTNNSNLPEQIRIASFNGTGLTVLYSFQMQSPVKANISGIDFSNNDLQLFISAQAEDVQGNLIDRKQEIFRINLNGSNQVRLTNNNESDTRPSTIPGFTF